jgi:hypothetical protein
MRINEVLTESRKPDLIEIFRDFFPLAMEEIGLKTLPDIKLELRIRDDKQPTFGKFVNNENRIHLAIEDRHPLDILRTLAHELVHYRQGVEHMLDATSGETGSPAENQAHEIAGIVMRNFNKKYPKYFNVSAVNLVEAADILDETKWDDFKKEFTRKGKQSLYTTAAMSAGLGGLVGYDYAKDKFQNQSPQQYSQQQLIPSDDNTDFYPYDSEKAPASDPDQGTEEKEPESNKLVQPPLSPEYFKKYVEMQKHRVFDNPIENELQRAAMKRGIVGLELDQLLAECSHESMTFTEFDEAKRKGFWRMGTETLTKAWFLANRHYWKYRGRGLIQITTEPIYKQIGKKLGIDLVKHPELASSKKYLIPIALAYWELNVQPRVPKDQMGDTAKVAGVINPRGSHEALIKRHNLFQQFINWFKKDGQ